MPPLHHGFVRVTAPVIAVLFALTGSVVGGCDAVAPAAGSRAPGPAGGRYARRGLLLQAPAGSVRARSRDPVADVTATESSLPPEPRIRLEHPPAAPSSAQESPAIPEGLEARAGWTALAWGNPIQVETRRAEARGAVLSLQLREGRKDKWAVGFPLDVEREGRLLRLQVDCPRRRAIALALAVEVGSDSSYYESKTVPLEKGWNTEVSFSFDAATWKSAASDWQHTESVPSRPARRLVLLLYGSALEEAVRFDDLQFEAGATD